MKYFALVCLIGVSGLVSNGMAGTTPAATPSAKPFGAAPAPAPSGSASAVRCGFSGAPPCALLEVKVTAPATKPTPLGPTLLPGSTPGYTPPVGTNSLALNPQSPFSPYYNNPAFRPLSPQIIDQIGNPCAHPGDYGVKSSEDRKCQFRRNPGFNPIQGLAAIPADTPAYLRAQAEVARFWNLVEAESKMAFNGKGGPSPNMQALFKAIESMKKLENLKYVAGGVVAALILVGSIYTERCSGASWTVDTYTCRDNGGKGAVYHTGKRRASSAYAEKGVCDAETCDLDSTDADYNPGVVIPRYLLASCGW